MKRLLLITVLFSLLLSCGSGKQIEKALYAGNYNRAITSALKKLDSNKDKKRKQQFIVLLEEAYYKAVEHDLLNIDRLKQDGNPEHLKVIYDLYVNLEARQQAIKPVLPLKIGRKVITFNFNDYSNDIIATRDKLSKYKYGQASQLLVGNDKLNNREAYAILRYIESINPNYKDVRQLMKEAHYKGTDFVLVHIDNQTHQIIPQRLENELLNFDTYGLNNFWTVYHANENATINYDYAMQLQLKRITISPERINEHRFIREKEIVDGWEYVLDENGNVVSDSLGNDIKVDRIINIRAQFVEIEQFKSTQIVGKVVYTDLNTNAILNVFTIDSEFIFRNSYARVRGDRRALKQRDRKLLDHRRIPFPSNAEMVLDTGEDLKNKLKNIINNYGLSG
jgi:hypothetical protein